MKVAIGQDSHKFDFENLDSKDLIIGGVIFENNTPLKGNSDADVVLHALTNAISGITGKNILGSVADEMCKNGITDSKVYLKESLKYLKNCKINHVSFSIECMTPKISPKIDLIKASIASLLGIDSYKIGITATTGEGLTDFGKGMGIQTFCIITCI